MTKKAAQSLVSIKKEGERNMIKIIKIVLVALMVFSSTAYAQNAPSHIEQKIREIYAQKYPDNYSMQKTLINNQLTCYSFMQRYTSADGVPQNTFHKIKSIYADKYPYNYSMQKTLVQNQVEAYRFMQNYISEPGVPQNVLKRIKQKYQAKYSYNFSMQKTLVKNQVQSYLDLNR